MWLVCGSECKASLLFPTLQSRPSPLSFSSPPTLACVCGTMLSNQQKRTLILNMVMLFNFHPAFVSVEYNVNRQGHAFLCLFFFASYAVLFSLGDFPFGDTMQLAILLPKDFQDHWGRHGLIYCPYSLKSALEFTSSPVSNSTPVKEFFLTPQNNCFYKCILRWSWSVMSLPFPVLAWLYYGSFLRIHSSINKLCNIRLPTLTLITVKNTDLLVLPQATKAY